MKTLTKITIAALVTLGVGAASPALAGKLNFGGKFGQIHLLTSKNKQAKKPRKVEDPAAINPGTRNWIKRLNAGRGSGFNGGFSGRPGGP